MYNQDFFYCSEDMKGGFIFTITADLQILLLFKKRILDIYLVDGMRLVSRDSI